jgi:autotransporter-associated beta strand protein
VNLGSTLTISGAVGDLGSMLGLTKIGGGTLALSSANTYGGGTTVSAGIVRASNATSLGTGAGTVSSGAAVEVSGGITIANALTLSGSGVSGGGVINSTAGSNTLSGAITLPSHASFSAASGSTLTISGAIGQTGLHRSISKIGAGTLVLSGTSTYDDTTDIVGGTLVVTGDISAGYGVYVNSGTTLAGTGSIARLNGYSGGTVAPGTTSTGILSTANVTFASGMNFNIDLNGTIPGTDYDRLAVTGTVNLANATLNVSLGYAPVLNEPFKIINNDGNDAVIGTFNGLAEGSTLTIGAANFTISYVGGDGNDVTLTFKGYTYTWDGGGSDFYWTTAANWVGDVAPVPGSDVTLVFPEGAQRLTNTNDFANTSPFGSIVIAGAGYELYGNEIDLYQSIIASYTSGESTSLLYLVLQANTTIDVYLGGFLAIDAAISGGAYSLTKVGGGTLKFAGGSSANTYTGDTIVADGRLILAKDNGTNAIAGDLYIPNLYTTVQLGASNQISDASTVSVGSTSTFDLSTYSDIISNLILDNATVEIGDGGVLTVSIGISFLNPYGTTSTIQGDGALDLGGGTVNVEVQRHYDVTVDGRISVVIQNGSITKLGSGILALSGANAYAGTTTISDGAIQVESSNALGSTAGVTNVADGAALYISGNGLSIAENFGIDGTGISGGGAINNLSGDNTISGNLILGSASSIGAASSSTLTISGSITDSLGSLSLTKVNSGMLVLSAANSYDQGTIVSAGILRVNHDDALGTGNVTVSGGAALELSGGVTVANGISINGSGVSSNGALRSISGENTVTGGINLGGSATIGVDSGSRLDVDAAGISAGVPTYELTKVGAGILSLNAQWSASFFGAMNVVGGDLRVNSNYQYNPVNVFDGGTLGGLGIVGVTDVASGGTLSPGNSPSALTTGNLSLATGSVFFVELPGDRVEAIGTVNLDSDSMGGATLTVVFLSAPTVGQQFMIIDNNTDEDPVTGTFYGLPEGATFSVGAYQVTITYVGGDGNDVELTVTSFAFVWSGLDIDDSLWSSPDNWVGHVAPISGASLLFPDGAARLSNTNDFSGFAFNNITIAAAGYTLAGNAIDLEGDILASYTSGTSTISLDLVMQSARTFDVATGGTLIASGVISGAYDLTKTGGGTLEFAGTSANTYSGTYTYVYGGTLSLNKTDGVTAVPNELYIGDGTIAATAILNSNNQISDTSGVLVDQGSTLNLNGFDETFKDLTMNAGTVEIPAASTLTLTRRIKSFDPSLVVGSVIQGAGTLDLNGAAAFTINVADDVSVDRDLVISTVIANGGIAKTGMGLLVLSGNNTYSGETTIGAFGGIQVESDTALGDATGSTSFVGSGAYLTFSGANLSIAEDFTITGNGPDPIFQALASTSVTITGNITIIGNTKIGAVSGSTLTINGDIDDGASSYSLFVQNGATGRTILGGNNLFDGLTGFDSALIEGYLMITNAGALGDVATSNTFFIEDGATLEISGGITLPSTKTLALQGTPVTGVGKIINVSGDNTIAGAVTLEANESISVGSGTTLTMSGAIGESGGSRNVTKVGSGMLIVGGTSTYSGDTTISAGTLIVSGNISSSSNTFIGNGGTLGGTGTAPGVTAQPGGTISPGNSPGVLNSGTANFFTGSTFVAQIDGTTLGTAYDQLNVTGSVNLNFDTMGGATLSVSLGYVPRVGDAFTIINNDSTDAIIGTFNGLAEGATITIGNVELRISYTGGTDSNDVVLTVTDVTYIWDGEGGDNLWSNPINWVSDVAPTEGAHLIFPISALRMTNFNDLIAGFDVYSITIDASGYHITGNAIDLIHGIEATNGSGTASFDTDIALLANQTFYVEPGGALSMAGVISGVAFGPIKSGDGTLVLSGANTYTGATIVSNGVLRVESDTALGTAAGSTTVASGASLYFAGSGLVLAEPLTIDGSGVNGDGVLVVVSGSATLTGAITLTGSSPDLVATAGTTLTINGVIDDGASLLSVNIINAPTGRVVLGGSNLFDGAVVVSSGFVRGTNDNAFGDPASSSNIIIQSGSSVELSGGITIPATKSLTLTGAGVSGSDKLINVAGNNTYSGAVTLSNDQSVDTASGTSLVISGAIGQTGIFSLFKDGTGTLTLGGSNSYSGITTINSGTLLVTGSIASNYRVDVQSTGTLGGSGTVSGVQVATGGTVAPGNSPGILNTGNITFASGSLYSVELNGTTAGCGYDQLNVTGTVSLGNSTLNVSLGFVPTIGDVFRIINNDLADAITGTFNGLPEGSTITVGVATFTISYIGGNGNDVTLTATDVSYTWDGEGADNLWSNPLNWVGDVVPTAGARLIFPNYALRFDSVSDLGGGFVVYSITIDDSAYFISGNSIDLLHTITTTYSDPTDFATFSIDTNAVNNVEFAIGTGGLLNFYATLGGVGLTKTGGGVLDLGGTSANTLGAAYLNAGGVFLSKPEGVQALPGAVTVGDNTTSATVEFFAGGQLWSNLTINENSTVRLNGYTQTIPALTLNGGTLQIGTGGVLTIQTSVTTTNSANSVVSRISSPGTLNLNSGTVTFNVAHDATLNYDLLVSAVVTSGAITKSGGGSMYLTGNNTYAGVTTVSAGSIFLGHSNALGTTAGKTVVSSGATVALVFPSLTVAEPFEISGTGVDGRGALGTYGVNGVISGTILLNADSTIGVVSGLQGLGGVISDGGNNYAVSFYANSTGTTRLLANNTYGGATTVLGGTLRIERNNGFGLSTASSTVTVNDGASLEILTGVTTPSTKTIKLVGAPLTGQPKLYGYISNNQIDGKLILDGSQTIAVASPSKLVLGGGIEEINGSHGITVTGTGTLNISGGASYTGVTDVVGGTLLANSDISTSNITVESGAKLGGTGTAGDVSVLSGGTVTPGNSAGTLNTGDVAFASGSIYKVEISGGGSYDQLNVSGTVSLGDATLTVVILSAPAIGDTLTIINNDDDDPVVGTFFGLPEGSTFTVGSVTFTITYAGGSDENDVVLTATDVTYTWDGGSSTTSNWSDAVNWVGDVVPTEGARLIFPDGAARLVNFNNLADGFLVYSITIGAAGYNIMGNDLDLISGFTGNYATGFSNLSLRLNLQSDATFDVVTQHTQLFYFGGIMGVGYGVTKTGGGTLVYQGGSIANTYTGDTLVNDGWLYLLKDPGTTAIAGNLIIGDNSTTAPVVLLGANNQIADTATVTVNEGATFNLNTFADRINALVLRAGTVYIPDASTGILTVATSITSHISATNQESSIEGSGTLNLGASGAFSIAVDDDVIVDRDLVISAAIANGGINKSGGGLLALSGDNTYAGLTLVSAGIIQVESDNALGTTAGMTSIAYGASVYFSGVGLEVAENFLLVGSGVNSSGALWVASGHATLSGNVSVYASFQVGAASDSILTFGGRLSDGLSDHAMTVTNGAMGRTVFNGNSNPYYSGPITVTAGFVRASNSGAFGYSNYGAKPITIEDGATLELSNGITLPDLYGFILNGSPVIGFSKLMNLDGDNTIEGPVTLGDDQVIDVAAGSSLTIDGVIDEACGASGLSKSGVGVLDLRGTNIYSGPTLINGGTLLVNGAIGNSHATVGSGATLGGTGGTADVIVLSGGTVAPGNSPGVLYTGSVSFATGAIYSVELAGTGYGEYDQIDGTGFDLDSDSMGGATLTLSLLATPAMGDHFTILRNAGGSPVVGTFIDLPEGAEFTIGAVTFTISYVGGDGDDVVLTVIDVSYIWDGGSSTSSDWSDAINWVGDVVPTAGARLIFPDGAARLTNLNDLGGGFDVHSITIGAAGYTITGNAIDLVNGIAATYNSGSSSFALDFEMLAAVTVDVAVGGTLDLGGGISSSVGGLTKTSSGTLVVSGNTANTYSGTTYVNSGTLVLNKNGVAAIPVGLVIGDGIHTAVVRLEASEQIESYVSLVGGATFDLNGFIETISGLDFTEGTVSIPAGSTLILQGSVSVSESPNLVTSLILGPGILDLDGDDAVYFNLRETAGLDVELRVSAVIANGGIFMYDYGTLALAAANTYAGQTYLEYGVILVEHEGALGTTDGDTEIESGSAVRFAGGTFTIAEIFKIGGSGVNSSGVLYVDSGSTTLNGNITMTVDSQVGAASGASLTINGAISADADNYYLFIKSGATGQVVLGGDNTYEYWTEIYSGFVTVTNPNAFGNPTIEAGIDVYDGATLQLSGGITLPSTKSLYVYGAGVSGGALLSNVDGDNTVAGPVYSSAHVAIDVSADTTLTLAGNISESVAGVELHKQGAGTLVLAGASSYTGDTRIFGGVLIVTGSLAGSGIVGVFPSATLAGTGSVGTINAGSPSTVAPGVNSTGILSATGVNLVTGTTFVVEINGPTAGTGYDQLNVFGEVNLDYYTTGGATLTLDVGYTPGIGTTFVLVNNDGCDAVLGTFVGLPEGSTITIGAATYTISYVGGDGNDVTLTATDVSYIWSGASDDGRAWSIGANWIGGFAPTPNSRLIFPDAPVRTESLNDFVNGTEFYSITIAGAGYDIYGNGIGLTEGITATFASGSSSFALDIARLQALQTYTVAGGTLDLGGAITRDLSSLSVLELTGTGTFIFSGAGDNTIYRLDLHGPDLVLSKSDSATAISRRALVYSGSTLKLGADGQFDPNSSFLYFYEETTFDLNGYSTGVYDIGLQGATVEIPTGSTLTLEYVFTSDSLNNVSNRIRGGGTLDLFAPDFTFYVNDDPEVDVDLIVSVALANGGIVKEGLGILALSGANTYEGLTHITAGAIIATHNSSLGTIDGDTIVEDGASLWFATSYLPTYESISISGIGLNGQNALGVLSGVVILFGPLGLTASAQIGAADEAVLAILGTIGEAVAGSNLTVANGQTGVTALGGDNSFTGNVLVSGGVLVAFSNNALGDAFVSSQIIIADSATLALANDITIPATKSLVLQGGPAPDSGKLVVRAGDNVYDGTITLQTNAVIEVGEGSSLVINGAIAEDCEPRGITKIGDGTLVLAAVNSYTGVTLVSAGALLVNGAITAPAGVVVSGGATLGGSGSVPDVAVGSGGTIAPGNSPGILYTASVNFATGAIYSVEIAGRYPGSGYDMVQGGPFNLDYDDMGGATLSITLIATPHIGDQILLLYNVYGGVNHGTFYGLPEGAHFFVNNVEFAITYYGGDGDDVVLNVIDVSYIWDGEGSDNLWSNPINWVGDVVPTAGSRLFFPSGAQRLANVNDLGNGFTIYSITIGAAGYELSGNAIDLDAELSTTYLAGQSSILFNIDFDDHIVATFTGGTFLFGGTLSGTRSLTLSGPATVVFTGTGANDYEGTSIYDGLLLILNKPDNVIAAPYDLIVGSGSTVRLLHNEQIANGIGVTLGENALLDLNGHTETFTYLYMTGANVSLPTNSVLSIGYVYTYVSSNHQASVISGPGDVLLNGTTRFYVSNDPTLGSDLVVSSRLTGTGGIRNSDYGTLELSAANTYTGATGVSYGIILAKNGQALGSADGITTISSGAAVHFDPGIGGSFEVDEYINVYGYGRSGSLNHGAISVVQGTVTLRNTVFMYDEGSVGAGPGATLNITGGLDGYSGYELTVDNAPDGVVILAGDNSLFTEDIFVAGGILRVANSNALGNPTHSTLLTVEDGASVQFTGGISTPSTKSMVLEGAPTADSAKVVNLSGNNSFGGPVSYVDDYLSVDVAGDSRLTFPGVISGSESLDKTGNGTLLLSGVNEYTGATKVYSGTLVVNGDITASSVVFVFDGGTLGGTGYVPGTSIYGGGTISPGQSTGILNTGDLDLAIDSIYSVEINGTTAGSGYDRLDVIGTVAIDNALLNISLGTTPAIGTVFTIIQNDDSESVTGHFDNLPEGAAFTVGEVSFRISYIGGDGNDVILTVIATPSVNLQSSANPSQFGQPVVATMTVSGDGPTPTGTVQFYIDDVPFGAPVQLDASGHASIDTSSLSVGTHVIAAHYSGDELYAPRNATLSGGQVVSKGSTNTTLQSSPASPVYGQLVTYTATVTPSFSGSVAGTVAFYDGETLLGYGPLVGGVATYSTSTLSAGPHSITAVYQGNDNYQASTSSASSQTVAQASSTTTLNVSPLSQTYGQETTLTATVSPQYGGAVSGTVSFYSGSTYLGVGVLVDGVATLLTSTIPAGMNGITAVYSGDVNIMGGTSLPTQQTVAQATSSTTLQASSTTPAFGESVTFTATVTPQYSGTPGGTVQFFDGDTLLATVNVDESGHAQYTTSSLSMGSHSIVAVYSGNANFLTSTSPAVVLDITQSQTTGGAITTPTPHTFFGQTATFVANFSAPSNQGNPISGLVDFYVDNVYAGTVEMQGSTVGGLSIRRTPGMVSVMNGGDTVYGQATFSTSTLGVGQHLVRAVYLGNTYYSGASTEFPVEVLVTPAQTSTSLGVTTTPESTTLIANVVVTSGGDPAITGTVAFYDGNTLLGTVPLVNGVATLTIGALSPGVHTLSAVYSGDGSVSSSAVSETVNTTGPRILGLSRFGIHTNPTLLVLTFDSSLDAASAENLANYIVTTTKGVRIPVISARYNSVTNTVTLRMGRRLSLYQTYRLTVVGTGSTPVKGASGTPLDGSGTGQSGTDFHTNITWKSLSMPGRAPAITFVNGHPRSFVGTFKNFLRRLRKGLPTNV